jgi:hypothetical protein
MPRGKRERREFAGALHFMAFPEMFTKWGSVTIQALKDAQHQEGDPRREAYLAGERPALPGAVHRSGRVPPRLVSLFGACLRHLLEAGIFVEGGSYGNVPYLEPARRISQPPTPPMTDAVRMPTLAVFNSGLRPKARLAMNRDIVKPMPASQLAP